MRTCLGKHSHRLESGLELAIASKGPRLVSEAAFPAVSDGEYTPLQTRPPFGVRSRVSSLTRVLECSREQDRRSIREFISRSTIPNNVRCS